MYIHLLKCAPMCKVSMCVEYFVLFDILIYTI